MDLIMMLLQQMSVFFVIVYMFSKSPAFKALAGDRQQFKHKVILYLTFTTLSILGTYFGLPIKGAIANTRSIGAVMGGMLGGPYLGAAIGLTSGLHRYTMGGFTDLACGIATVCDGLIGGMAYLYLRKKNEPFFNPKIAFFAAFYAGMMQMLIIVMLSRPFEDAVNLVQLIALPMILANATGAALFTSLMRDQKTMVSRYKNMFSARALKLAERTMEALIKGFNKETAAEVARIIYEETKVGAVSITDKKHILAFIGIGSDHHIAGKSIACDTTQQAIKENKVIYADGVEISFKCPISEDCQLGSTLVIPLQDDSGVIGTIKLYEPKKKLFLNLNKTLGEGIASLISNQLLMIRYKEQKNLLTQSELKLIHAQINPHFLFNALNTIIAVTRKNSEQARELLLNLSSFFRKNLKRSCETSTIEEELEHSFAYLEIEKARFEDRLTIEKEIDPNFLNDKVPTFTLQPIIENAIKHGTSNILDKGVIKIKIYPDGTNLIIQISDNAGLYQESPKESGLGMNIVDKRIKNIYGERYGVSVKCKPDVETSVFVSLPLTSNVIKKQVKHD